ncbi:hypothetical protein BDV96DRAFT_573558 [Lophiotrema nucula]|uniref:RING-type domain-containing protein n=1 Tax=Lophiotrema nucula TaxID=690887 RepID=A0A6A5ZCV4_9PLEO|nr:hypothetical protein BDV96DRAFT_573558 [Lophiotrema nucula]
MSRIQQDQFVDDDEEECCPLCVEEFDLSDKNFRPCPCGYQICQFCFNNIRTTMNGLCPACRRPYDESTIEFKNITPEEMAKHKQQIAQKAKKNAALRQKEAQKAEADSLSRKHLSGLRVVQKNLVYVTGLTPTIREDRLLETLRGPEYFGQYGKIIKIVVSKAKENAQHQQSVGVYVTFARKEDAAQCISAVDGSQNGDRTLRAQYGTTKYCSAYLRGEQCNNRNCMFLHEPGEENDSFTRQDLSLMNSISTQQPAQSQTSHAAPPPHRGPAVAAAAPMHRQDSNDAQSPISGGDAPALPATANWGSKVTQERRASRSTSASNPSPMTSNATPAQSSKPTKADEPLKKKGKEKDTSAQTSKSATPQSTPAPVAKIVKPKVSGLDNLLKAISNPDFKFVFSGATFTPEELEEISNFPQLLDPNGGAKRRAAREKQKEKELEAQQREIETQDSTQTAPAIEREETIETTAGGSLQLGGEPEERHDVGGPLGNQQAIAPPGQHGLGGGLFGQNSLTDDFASLGINRGLTPQQQQQLLLIKAAGNQSAGPLSNFQANPSQPQNHNQASNAPGHARHASRFSFANDSSSASASVQPVANQKLMNQQSTMMPKNTNHFNQLSQHQPLGSPFYASGVQGPPPGLKATGTPPVSGGGMFGQGHGFATGGLGYGANAAGRNNNDAMYQDLLRGGRNMDGGARLADAGKHDQLFSPEEPASINVDALVNDSDFEPPMQTPIGAQALQQPRRATPTIPPGFTIPAISKSLHDPPSRPLSRNNYSIVTPAVPFVPVTPIRPATPTKPKEEKAAPEPGPAQASASSGKKAATSTKLETPSKLIRKASSVKTQPLVEAVDQAAQSSPNQNEGNLATAVQLEQKSPSKGAIKNKVVSKKAQTDTTPVPSPHKDVKHPGTNIETIPSSRRQHPGRLDIAAATTLTENVQPPAASSKAEGVTKNVRAVSLASTNSVPSSPMATSTGSPIKRSTAPRTLRVVPTPKTEHPPPLSAVSATSVPHVPTVEKLRSRQASIASINMPGTPASELISDTASITSASVSRASSPPPIGGKVGTAPVRKKTKSQAKKERQERARQIAEEQAAAVEDQTKSELEPEQAPIMGRKKKTKKPGATIAKPQPLPGKSQPPSPKPAKVEEEEEEEEEEDDDDEPETKTPVVAAMKGPSRKTSVSSPRRTQPSPVLERTPTPDLPREKGQATAQSIIADLQKTGELLVSTLEFFKPLSASLAHAARTSQANSTSGPLDLKINFSEADLDALAKKKPVRLSGQNRKSDSRTLITPQGKFFWGLTQELEEKALELEKHIEELRGATRFHPRKQANHPHAQNMAPNAQPKDVLPAIATALKEAGAKLSKTAAASQPSQPMSKLDPTSSLLGSTSLPLPPVQAPADPAWLDMSKQMNQSMDLPPVSSAPPQPPPQPQTPADAVSYLNQFVIPKSDSPGPSTARTEMAAVGGLPGAGISNMTVTVNKIAKAAKAVAEGGSLPGELEGMGVMAADVLGGVVVQGLEALVGAGLGFHSNQDLSVDGQGNITLGGNGLDVKGLMEAVHSGSGLGGFGQAAAGQESRRGRKSVLSVDEAEQAMLTAKKENEVLEKKLAGVMKRNKKMVGGMGKA